MQLLYATFAHKEEALKIARVLVEEHLVACANIVDGATSIYRWEGTIEEQPEVAMFAKTAHPEQAIARIKTLHSYALPCVLTLPVQGGNPEFIEWVEKTI